MSCDCLCWWLMPLRSYTRTCAIMSSMRRIVRWIAILAVVPLWCRCRRLSLLLLLLRNVAVRRLHACYEYNAVALFACGRWRLMRPHRKSCVRTNREGFDAKEAAPMRRPPGVKQGRSVEKAVTAGYLSSCMLLALF